MKTKKINIEELKPYLNNAKLHPNNQIEQLKKSIKDYGYIAPVIVDSDYNIIAGHGRYQALTELDYEDVEVVIVDNLSEDKIKEYRLLDNKLNSNSDYSKKALELELLDLPNFDYEFFDFKITNINEDLEFDFLSEEDINDLDKDVEDKVPDNKCVCPKCGYEFEK